MFIAVQIPQGFLFDLFFAFLVNYTGLELDGRLGRLGGAVVGWAVTGVALLGKMGMGGV